MRMRLPVVVTMSLALAAILSPAVQAREGFYIGLGAVQQTVGGDFDGTHTLRSQAGTTAFFDGKLDSGDVGMELQVGYGLTRYFGLEFLYANSQHTAHSKQLNRDTDAEFTAQVYGARLTIPFGERVEAFLRAGYGVYEIDLNNFSLSGVPLQKMGNVKFLGSGSAAGAGLEYYTGNWRWGLGYTQHNYVINRAKPEHSNSQALPKDLTGTAGTTDFTLAYHFGT